MIKQTWHTRVLTLDDLASGHLLLPEGLTTWDLVLHTLLILGHGLLLGLNSELPRHQRLVWWSLNSWLHLDTLARSGFCLAQVLRDFILVSEGTALPGSLWSQLLNPFPFPLLSYSSLCCSPKDYLHRKSSMEDRWNRLIIILEKAT